MNLIRSHLQRAGTRLFVRSLSSSATPRLTCSTLANARSIKATRREPVYLGLMPIRCYTSQTAPPTNAVSGSSSTQQPTNEENEQVEEDEEMYEEDAEDSMTLEAQSLMSLEDAAHSPWINLPSSNHRESLERSYFLLFQVFMYLGRPQKNVTEEDAAEYLLTFQNDECTLDSEMDRARKSVCLILSAVCRTMSSVPDSSPLREKHKEIFDTFGALIPLNDMYLGGTGGLPEDWRGFWERAMPVCITLCQQLNMGGFGFDDDEW